jgi:methyl-accepting chemotaxis protein
MKFTIRKKLSISFGIILLLMVLSSVITFSLLVKNETIQKQIISLRMKTVLLSKDVTIAINESMAALSGYMILGHDTDKAELMISTRLKAWNKLEAAITQYDKLAQNWTVKANIQRLQNIKTELANFKSAQQEIDAICSIWDDCSLIPSAIS